MIIATGKADTILKKSLGKGQVLTTTPAKMFEQFALDPNISDPKRDAYIVTNEDISAARLKAQFEQALLTKHPATKVIFINKTAKPIYPNGLQGIDAVLQKPKAQDVAQTISVLLEQQSFSEVAVSYVQETQEIPGYTPPKPMEGVVEEVHGVQEEPEELVVENPLEEVEETVVEEVKPSAAVRSISESGSVKDITILMREMSNAELLKDLAMTNSTYAGIEQKVKALNDAIFAIMSDPTIKNLDEKLVKVHALLHDRAFFGSKGDSLILQRLEEVIDTVCTKTSELLQSRLDEIETAIKRSRDMKDMENMNPRLAGLTEERANIIAELLTLQVDIQDIYTSTDMLCVSVATDMSERSNLSVGDAIINTQLEARGIKVVTDETSIAIRSAIEITAEKLPDIFKEFSLKIATLHKLINKMFEVDSEIIAAQQQLINLLKAKNIEDTVVADTLLKKSLRVFVGGEGSGKTIIPYLLSKYKSRQNANVLCLDLTGTHKYADYGISYMSLDAYLMGYNQKEFNLVAGLLDDSIEAGQRIVTALIKAADYYRVINVILTPQQRELLETISQDVLCVNYLVDTNNKRIEEMKEVIERSNFTNVARRVIINRCDVPIGNVIKKLGLNDSIDFQICTIPTITVLTDASLTGYDPYGVSKVDFEMGEILKHA